MRLASLTGLCLALSLQWTPALAAASPDVANPDHQAIESALDAWVTAYNAGDVDGVMNVWAGSVAGWYPGSETRGLVDTWNQYARISEPDFDGSICLDIVEIDVEGDMAYVHDLWTVRSAGTSELLRSFEIWRKQPSGDWRIVRWISYPETSASEQRTCSVTT